jgi:hypothetical protein
VPERILSKLGLWGIVTSVVFATIGVLFAFGALIAWKKQQQEAAFEEDDYTEESEISQWVHECRREDGGRLVAAVIDTHLPVRQRVDALREISKQYSDLGLPAREDAYRLLSAREDLNRAVDAGLSDNAPALIRASLLTAKSHELCDHCDAIAALIQRVLTNPTPSIKSVRILSIQTLADFGERAHESTLIDVIEMGGLEEREAAIRGLASFGTARAVPGLQATAANTAMQSIRGHALAAITTIQTRIGPVEAGILSISEASGNLSMADRGGALSQVNGIMSRSA